MFRKVLLVNSGTLDADGAWDAALALASRFHAELHMVLVEELPRFPISIGEVDHEREVLRQRTTYIVSSASTRAAEASVAFEAHIVVGRLVPGVLSTATETQCDLLVVGAKGRTILSDLIYGRPGEQLSRAVACPVLMINR
jgi:nucleotide-binding universal stress UspA family protein